MLAFTVLPNGGCMIKKLLFILLTASIVFPQAAQTTNYEKGLKYLASGDTVNALLYLKQDAEENEKAGTYYQLAMILQRSSDYYKMREADDCFEKAIDKEPLNIKYRLEYGKYLEMVDQKVRDDITARKKAKEQYEKIIEINSSCADAYFQLGKLQYNDFLDYHNSYYKDKYAAMDNIFATSASGRSKLKEDQWEKSQEPQLSFEGEASKYFEEAERYLQIAIKNDSSFYDAYLKLADLYEDSGDYQKGIEVIKQLLSKKENDFSYHALLALLYFRYGDNELSNKVFQKAITLMPKEEKDDYLVNTVKMFLPVILKKDNSITENEVKQAIEIYWNSKDPIVLTEANERLVEHFARVSYANLRFSSANLKLKGWKSDRGEALIRYGFPNKRIRYRPHADDTGMKVIRLVKTDVWVYDDFTLAFTDQFLTNQFQFNSPSISGAVAQHHGNTDDLVKLDLRGSKPEIYFPKTKGPIFNIPYKTYQFASSNKNMTDTYLTYQINFEDTASSKVAFSEGYEVGLFLNDKSFARVFESMQTVHNPIRSVPEHCNSIIMKAKPQNGNLAFEIIRKKDNGIAAYHGKFTVRNYNSNELQLSDLICAKELETESKLVGAIERKNISIVANPTNQFSDKDRIYLYYEIYNLKLRNSLTDFEQKLTIRKRENGIWGAILSVVGSDGKGNKVTLTSNYQTEEKDPQMYLQLDMSNYGSGDYLITITIRDKTTNKTVSVNSEIYWQ